MYFYVMIVFVAWKYRPSSTLISYRFSWHGIYYIADEREGVLHACCWLLRDFWVKRIMMYDSNGLNIQKGWKRESQHFRILQPNGCKIRKCWDSRFPVQIILIPLLNGLKMGKSWNWRSQIFRYLSHFSLKWLEYPK